MKNIKEILSTLIEYYDTTRQTGHTTTMLTGAINTDCLVLCHTLHMSKVFEQKYGKKIKVLTPYQLEHNKLRGYNKPLAFDNSVLYTLFRDCLSEITRLEKENNNAYWPTGSIKRKTKSKTNTVKQYYH